jgi:hypothetical protein
VRRLAAAAAEAHCRRDCEEALGLLASARDAWDAGDASGGDGSSGGEARGGGSTGSSGGGASGGGTDSSGAHGQRRARLGPSMELFFGLAACGVHLTEGRDDLAAESLRTAAPALDWLHEAGADTAAWHCAAGLVAHHLGDMHVRFCPATPLPPHAFAFARAAGGVCRARLGVC